MAKVDKAEIGKPQIRPADLQGADAAVFTVSEVLLKPSRFGGTKYVLTFAENDRELWLNKTGLNTVVDKYGDETDSWMGKLIPVRAVHVDVQGKQRHVVQVAQDWNDVLGATKKAAKKGRK